MTVSIEELASKLTLKPTQKSTVKIIQAEHDQYEHYRTGRVFSKNPIDRFPPAIALPTCVDEVVRAVNYARENNLKLSVRSGGHSSGAWGVRDGALLIDLLHLNELSFDEKSAIVTCSPSSTGRMVREHIKHTGYWLPGGHCPDVGLGGFLSQGGGGWAWRGYGWACSMIEWIDVVTPSGTIVHSSATENSDLLWAFCGSGPGFFGVVVRFGLKPKKVFKRLFQSIVIISGKDFQEGMKWLLDIGDTMAPMTELYAIGMRRKKMVPGGDPMEPVLRIQGTAWANDPETAKEMLSMIAKCPLIEKALTVRLLEEIEGGDVYNVVTGANLTDGEYYNANTWLSGSHANVAQSLESLFTTTPNEHTYAFLFSAQPNGIIQGKFANDITAPYYVLTYAMTNDGTQASRDMCKEWVTDKFFKLDEATERAEPGDEEATRTVGGYLGDGNQMLRPVRFMSEKNWVEWVAIRNKYDPEQRFVGYLYDDKWPINQMSWEPAPAADRVQ